MAELSAADAPVDAPPVDTPPAAKADSKPARAKRTWRSRCYGAAKGLFYAFLVFVAVIAFIKWGFPYFGLVSKEDMERVRKEIRTKKRRRAEAYYDEVRRKAGFGIGKGKLSEGLGMDIGEGTTPSMAEQGYNVYAGMGAGYDEEDEEEPTIVLGDSDSKKSKDAVKKARESSGQRATGKQMSTEEILEMQAKMATMTREEQVEYMKPYLSERELQAQEWLTTMWKERKDKKKRVPVYQDGDMEKGPANHIRTSTEEEDGSKVLELTGSNFSGFLSENPYGMVEFYSSRCMHSIRVASVYTHAADILYDYQPRVAFGRVEIGLPGNKPLMDEYGIKQVPFLVPIVNGARREYEGEFNLDDVVSYMQAAVMLDKVPVGSLPRGGDEDDEDEDEEEGDGRNDKDEM